MADTQRLSTSLNDARYDGRFKMPGYTGHVNGLMEVYASTPVHAAVRHSFHHLHSTAPHPPLSPPDACGRQLPHRDDVPACKPGNTQRSWRDGETRRTFDVRVIRVQLLTE